MNDLIVNVALEALYIYTKVEVMEIGRAHV